MLWTHKLPCKCHLWAQLLPLLWRDDILRVLSWARSQTTYLMPQMGKHNTLQLRLELSEADCSSNCLSDLQAHIWRVPQKRMVLTVIIPALVLPFGKRQRQLCTMANKSPETPTLSAFLTNGLSLEGQNTTIISALKCKTVKSGKNCTICHPQAHHYKEGSRIKVSLGAVAKGVAGMYYNIYSIRKKEISLSWKLHEHVESKIMGKGQRIYFIYIFLCSFLLSLLPLIIPKPYSDMFSFTAKIFYGEEWRLKVFIEP